MKLARVTTTSSHWLQRIPGYLIPWLVMLPFLFLGLVIIFLRSGPMLCGDEGRYYIYAFNLTQGYYSNHAPDLNLISGPGAPLIFAPFAWLNAPLIYWRMINAFFFYFGGVFFFKAMRIYLRPTPALVGSLLLWSLMLYYNRQINLIYSENIAIFLIGLLTYAIARMMESKERRWPQILLVGLTLGYLALTKVIFGYAIVVLGVAALLIWLFNRKKIFISLALSAMLALGVASPYLFLTHHLTGRIFYWSNYGGDNLYWLASPYPGEYGTWRNWDDKLHPEHREFANSISHLSGAEWDDALTRKAIENILDNPQKFLLNWFANVERLLFNFPIDTKAARPVFMFIPGMFIVVLSVLMVLPTFYYWRRIPMGVFASLGFFMVYFGGSSLGSATIRMFYVALPFLAVWLVYMYTHFVRFGPRFPLQSESGVPKAEPLSQAINQTISVN